MPVKPFSAKSSKNGKSYYLYSTTTQLNGGGAQTIYFFAGTPTNEKGTPIAAVPAGYEVDENKRSGLPYLKRKSG